MAKTKYNDLLGLVPDEKKPLARRLISDLEYYNALIDSFQAEIDKSGCVDLFQSGSQRFLRMNPAIKGLNDTNRQRNACITNLTALIASTKRDGNKMTEDDAFMDFLAEREQM